MTTRTCKVCGVEKEAIQGTWVMKRGKPVGLVCRSCASAKQNALYATPEGRAKAAESQAKYYATEKGFEARRTARAKLRLEQETARALRPKPVKLPQQPKAAKTPKPVSWKAGNRAWERYLDAKNKAKNPKKNASSLKWYAALVQATPKWLSPEMWLAMGRIYEKSYLGEKNIVIDHIVPLIGEDAEGNHVVCGLHVPWNLQYLTRAENTVKGSLFVPV